MERRLERRTLLPAGRGKRVVVVVWRPSRRFVYGVVVSIIALVLLTMLEVIHMLLLGSVNELILNAMVALAGGIMGTLIGFASR